jgi:hypothetical protein
MLRPCRRLSKISRFRAGQYPIRLEMGRYIFRILEASRPTLGATQIAAKGIGSDWSAQIPERPTRAVGDATEIGADRFRFD